MSHLTGTRAVCAAGLLSSLVSFVGPRLLEVGDALQLAGGIMLLGNVLGLILPSRGDR